MSIGSFPKVPSQKTHADPDSFLVSSSSLNVGASMTEPNGFLDRLLQSCKKRRPREPNPATKWKKSKIAKPNGRKKSAHAPWHTKDSPRDVCPN